MGVWTQARRHSFRTHLVYKGMARSGAVAKKSMSSAAKPSRPSTRKRPASSKEAEKPAWERCPFDVFSVKRLSDEEQEDDDDEVAGDEMEHHVDYDADAEDPTTLSIHIKDERLREGRFDVEMPCNGGVGVVVSFPVELPREPCSKSQRRKKCIECGSGRSVQVCFRSKTSQGVVGWCVHSITLTVRMTELSETAKREVAKAAAAYHDDQLAKAEKERRFPEALAVWMRASVHDASEEEKEAYDAVAASADIKEATAADERDRLFERARAVREIFGEGPPDVGSDETDADVADVKAYVAEAGPAIIKERMRLQEDMNDLGTYKTYRPYR